MIWIRSALAVLLCAGSAEAAIFTVTNENTSGAGSLAKAITDANATVALDTIQFAIPGVGVHSIPAPFPAITEPLVINGYTQAGSSVNTAEALTTNAVVTIRLDGSALPVTGHVLSVEAEDTTIRGLAINVIPGKGSGIFVAEGIDDVKILGNFIGVTPNGASDQSSGTGIIADGSALIGSATPADRNLISGNDASGILVRGFGSVIKGNLIGTTAAGAATLGNGVGIQALGAEARDFQIGDTVTGSGRNLIAGNGKEGILAATTAGTGIRIDINSIHSNGELGIDLDKDGPTLNDEFDSDDGPNDLVNAPEIAFVRSLGGTFFVQGALNAGPGIYRMNFYSSDNPDASEFGEGQSFLGFVQLQISGDADAVSFDLDFETGGLPTGDVFVTATAQRQSDFSTSEFSRSVRAIPGGSTFTVINTNDAGIGSLRNAITLANATPTIDTVLFSISGDGPHTIAPQSAYTITAPLIIDGYSEALAVPNKLYRSSDADLRIVVDGTNIGSDDAVFEIAADNVILRGLAIHSSAADGIEIQANAEDVRIEGNFLGTDATGTVDLGSSAAGIDVFSATDTLIGGFAMGNRNLISGNGLEGIVDRGTRTTIVGNLVGSDAGGETPLGNGDEGIRLLGAQTVVGDDDPLRTNLVANNDGAGITVPSNRTGLEIRGNDIDANGFLGIDLLGAANLTGVTANDANDADTGANQQQNFPEIDSAIASPGLLSITGSLDVPASRLESVYRLRVFAGFECDSSGNGEGRRFLAALNVFIPDDESFFVQIPAEVKEGDAITMTATDPETGDSSEFSACVEVTAAGNCGDANGDGEISASDALRTLKAAVGSEQCELCSCDVNDSGSVTSSDALFVLRKAVGQSVTLQCPPCA